MKNKQPKVSVDILVIKNDQVLLGLLTTKWNYNGRQVYGLPGREIRFGEKIGDTIKRNIKDELDCNVIDYKIICVNTNYALNNHYIGIGAVASIDGEPKIIDTNDWEKWEWFPKEKIPRNLFPPAENAIKCYLKNLINISK